MRKQKTTVSVIDSATGAPMVNFDLEPNVDLSGEVTKDATELVLVATFNGLCRLINALVPCEALSASVLEAIHDAMVTPLEDEQHCDDPTVSSFRDAVDDVFATSIALTRAGLRRSAN